MITRFFANRKFAKSRGVALNAQRNSKQLSVGVGKFFSVQRCLQAQSRQWLTVRGESRRAFRRRASWFDCVEVVAVAV